MLCRQKSVSTKFSTLLRIQNFLQHQLLRTKASRRHNSLSDYGGDDADNKLFKKHENQDGCIHLLKSRGQHLLTNPRVLDAIVKKSNIKPTDTVLEIGPGTGNLTLRLLQAAKSVVGVEIDKRMVEVLHNRAAKQGLQDRLTVICNDALKIEFPPFDLVVANIPYGISSPLVAKLVFGVNRFRTATLLLQKEFARRLLASPGDSEFNRLAVNVKLVADVDFVMDVSKRDFLPCPKVDSTLVKIHPKDEIPDVDLEEWWAFTRMCFNKKNKTLGAMFKQKRKLMELMTLSDVEGSGKGSEVNFGEDDSVADGYEEELSDYGECDGLRTEISFFREKVIDILRSGGFENKRPSKLSNDEFLCLLSMFNQAGICFNNHSKPKNGSKTEFAASYG